MCKWGTSKPVYVIRRANPFVKDGWHKVYVDSCIAEEIQMLNDNGVITLNSCCGHGKGNQIVCSRRKCFKVFRISYEPKRYKHTDIFQIKLLKDNK